jgi:hypothetical protein
MEKSLARMVKAKATMWTPGPLPRFGHFRTCRGKIFAEPSIRHRMPRRYSHFVHRMLDYILARHNILQVNPLAFEQRKTLKVAQ